MMKSLLKIVLLLFVCCSAVKGQDLQRQISVSYTDASLETVLINLDQQYDLKFSYSKDLVELQKKITVSVESASISQVLNYIFEQATIQYQIIGDQIVLKGKREADRLVALTGKVTDKTTNIPLAFASIRLDGTALGTATNNEGKFIFNLPEQYVNGNITISFVGYKSYHFPLFNTDQEMRIMLEEDTKELNTVVITAKTGRLILEEAISRIKQNYDTGAVAYTFYIKDLVMEDDEPIGASESIYRSYRGSTATPVKQLKFVKGRAVKDFTSYQNILQTFPRWTGFSVGTDIEIIFFGDLNAQRKNNALDEFPSPKFLARHQFELLGTSLLDDKEVYVITFDQKDAYKNKSLYKGKFYIDTETLAFMRIETEASPKGIRNARVFGSSKAIALLFGYAKCSLLRNKAITNYKIWNGKWYVSNMEVFWNVNLVRDGYRERREFISEIGLTSKIVVNDIQSGNILPFNTSDILTPIQRRDWLYMYDVDFWKANNMASADPDFEDAVQRVQSKNRKNGFDKNFWRRYQPYKNNPTLLARDSALCQEDPGSISDSIAEPLHLTEGTTNKLLEPKYPPLSASFSTKHFMMFYVLKDSSAAKEVSVVLERNYDRVLNDFQLTDLAERINVELYPDIENYHFAIGNPDAPDSEAGMAVDNNTFKMVSPANPGSYHTRETILKGAVHEFAHCVHYNLMEELSDEEYQSVRKNNEAPWLFEAIASYEAGQFYDPGRFDYLKKGQQPSLKELNDVEQNGKIYDVGYTIIGFILKTWGKESLIKLLKQNGNVQMVFGISESEFESKFYAYINTAYLKSER